jgi:hypothetical protein
MSQKIDLYYGKIILIRSKQIDAYKVKCFNIFYNNEIYLL